MSTVIPKEKILQALQPLPDETTVEDAIERLCFLAKVEEGLRQSNQGETVSHDEAARRLTA
jgi:predicted transcriptional regulator